MNIKLAKNSGFCFGVKRAIKLAGEVSNQYPETVTLGPIIHNPQMVKQLESKGIIAVESTDSICNRPVIIRSHGISKEKMEYLKELNVPVIDATCPYVSSTQLYATQLSHQGYPLMIVGNKDHPEVIALKSYVENDEVYIISAVEQIPDKKFNKLAVLCQTTQNVHTLQEIVKHLIPLIKDLRVINTICTATTVRQESTFELAQQSEIMIVIGGKNSSNTRMLNHICQKLVTTYLIETAEELECSWFANKENIGLTAGASTPDWIIVEVYNKITKCLGDKKEPIVNVESIPGYKEESNARQ
jgi:4-hydroxy-3-methylbut-2-en-1-yl diphosphate reductase